MELELRDGDYVADGAGGLRHVQDREALLQRALFRLTARRGTFPFWEELGRLPAPEQQAAARQYVAEALAEEPVTVEEVLLEQGEDGAAAVTVRLRYEGESLPVTVEVVP